MADFGTAIQGLPSFQLPKLTDADMAAWQAQQPKANPLTAGLSAGWHEMLGSGGAAVSALGKLVGAEPVAQWGADVAASRQQRAEKTGRPDLDVSPLSLEWSQLPSWAAYQAAKAAPMIAGTVAGAAALSPLIPEAVGAGALGGAAARLPTFLGGGGLRAGMTAAEATAARAAGANLATNAAAMTAAGTPLSAGSLYEEALNRGDPTAGDAARAVALAPFHAALGAMQPASFAGVLGRGLEGAGKNVAVKAAARVAEGAAGGSLAGSAGGAAQEAIAQTFRPDTDWGERARGIVDAALTSGVVGGMFGGAAGLLHGRGPVKDAAAKAKQEAETGKMGVDLGEEATVSPPPAPEWDRSFANRYLDEQGGPAQIKPTPIGMPSVEDPAWANPMRARAENEEAAAAVKPPAEPEPQAAPQRAPHEEIADYVKQVAFADLQPGDGPSKGTLSRFKAADEPELVAKAFDLQKRARSSEITEVADRILVDKGLAERPDENTPARVLDRPELEARVKAAEGMMVEAHRTGDDASRAFIQNEYAKAEKALNLYDAITKKPEGVVPKSPEITEKPSENKPLEAVTKPDNPVLEEGLAPLKRQDEFERARAQQAEQIEAARAAELPDIAAQRAVNEPIKFDTEAEQRNIALKAGAKKTLERLNMLTAEQQEHILSREEFNDSSGGSADPVGRLLDTVANNPVGIRKALAEYAGVTPEFFAKSGAEKPKAAVRPAVEPVAKAAEAAPAVAPITDHGQVLDLLRQHNKDLIGVQDHGQALDLLREYKAGLEPKAAPTLEAAQPLSAEPRVVKIGSRAKEALPATAHDEMGPVFRNVRGAGAENLPAWHAPVEKMAHALAEKLGMPKPRVAVGDLVEGRAKGGLYDELHHAIVLRGDLDERSAVNKVAHELGHAVKSTMWDGAGKAERDAILADFKRDRGTNKSTVAQERPITSWGDEGTGRRAGEHERSFDEWLAERVSRWLTTDKKPVSIAERFFKKIADTWNKIYEAVTGFKPESGAVKDFMDGLWERKDPTSKSKVETRIGGRVFSDEDPSTVPGQNNLSQRAMGFARDVLDRVKNLDIPDRARKVVDAMSSFDHLVQMNKDRFTTGVLEGLYDNTKLRTTAQQRWAEHMVPVLSKWDQLARSHPKSAELLNKVMSGRYQGYDGEKTWAEHTQFHNDKNVETHKRLHAELAEMVNSLKRTTPEQSKTDFAPIEVYRDMRSVMNSMMWAKHDHVLRTLLNTMLPLQEGLRELKIDPMKTFMEQASSRDTPAGGEKFWRSNLDGLITGVEKYVKDNPGKLTSGEEKAVGHMLETIRSSIKAIETAPYFHMGRRGEHYIEFKIRPTLGGKGPDEAARAAIEARLVKEGFDQYEIPEGTDNSQVYLRLDSKHALKNMERVVKDLQKQGFLAKTDEENYYTGGLRKLETGKAPTEFTTNKVIEFLRSKASKDIKPEDKAQYDKIVAELEQSMFELMPDSNKRVFLKREYVGGYLKDARWSQAARMQIASRDLASMYATPKITESFAAMRRDIAASKVAGDVDKTERLQELYNELSKRENDRAGSQQNELVNAVLAANHTFFLGMSPSYVVVQMTQLGALLWPELAKQKGGYVGSAKAIAKVTPLAFRIMREATSEAWKGGLGRLPDLNLTAEVLRKACGDTPEGRATADFLTRLVNKGMIDMGSASRELGRVEGGKEGTVTNTALKYGSMFGLYSEVFTRLIAALSAKEMHGSKGDAMERYAADVVKGTMLDYSSMNVARAFGQHGIAGPVTPISRAFMSYNLMVTEKLYRELGAGFLGMAKSEDEKRAARRFLGGHAAAMTVLAGSLGLPGASILASMLDRGADLFSEDGEAPFDSKAAYRNFLADTFGKDVGEVLARGVTRAVGIDISGRVGEQDIIPLSKLMTDRRKWDDVLKDWAWRTDGAPFSMAQGVLNGMSQLAGGDLLGGMKAMMPSALKGPVEAARMLKTGYVDAKGNLLPMTPSARDVLVQALGFQPSVKAEYGEERASESVRKSLQLQRTAEIRKQLTNAVLTQDQDGMSEWIAAARKHDENAPPQYQVLPTIGRVIQRTAANLAKARATETPIGTKFNDPGSMSLPRFGNIQYQ